MTVIGADDMNAPAASPDTSQASHTPPVHQITVRLFLSFVAGYFLSYALRSVNATIAPLLAEDLNLSASELGWLSAAYFLSFASVQWYLGTWLDKHGARRTESLLLCTAAIGSVIVAISDGLLGLSLGRILIGFGVAACLMAPYSYFRRCYAPEKQAQLAMWMLIGGTLGALAATQPTLMLAQWIGWREVFLICAGLLALSALAIARFVPDTDLQVTAQEKAQAGHAQNHAPPMKLMALLRHPTMLRVIPTTIFFSGGFVALQSLWVGPWLTDVLQLSVHETGTALLYFNAALLVAYLLMSFASPKLEKRGIGLAQQTKIGFVWFLGCMALILIWRTESAWWAWLVMAPGIPAVILMQTQTALMFPKAIAGRVLTTFNLVMFGGAFCVQWGIGLIVDGFMWMGAMRDTALWLAFIVLFVLQVMSLWWFFARSKPVTGDI
jgi:predicted MFS family arabinose efflux permease